VRPLLLSIWSLLEVVAVETAPVVVVVLVDYSKVLLESLQVLHTQ
jgi:hypothetical protein